MPLLGFYSASLKVAVGWLNSSLRTGLKIIIIKGCTARLDYGAQRGAIHWRNKAIHVYWM